jgi:hypothetical protein
MSSTPSRISRIVATVLLLGLGLLSLPLVAIFFDGEGQENWIIPVQVVVMALIGAGVGLLVPSLGGAGASKVKSAVVGALIALAGVVLSLVLFFLLLSGLEGP